MAKDFTEDGWTLDFRELPAREEESEIMCDPSNLTVEVRDTDGNIMEIPDDKMIVSTPHGDYLIDALREKGVFYYEGNKLGETKNVYD